MRTALEIVASLRQGSGDGRHQAEQLCQECTEDLSLEGTALALTDRHGLHATFAASSLVVEELERLQGDLGEGPSIDAVRTNEPTRHGDLDHAGMDRWPSFAPAALDAGIQAVFALPLRTARTSLGSLALYRSSRGPLGDASASAARAYAGAAVALCLDLHAQSGSGDGVLHADLEASLDHQAEVHQATGFVSVRAGVAITDALVLLRAHAYASERPVVEVARDVLAGRIDIPSLDGPDGTPVGTGQRDD